MASRIKGITVEIGGDTTGLDKALRSQIKQPFPFSGCFRDTNGNKSLPEWLCQVCQS